MYIEIYSCESKAKQSNAETLQAHMELCSDKGNKDVGNLADGQTIKDC